jgi:spore maturation protein CgeB
MSLNILVIGPASPYPWMAYVARALRRLGHRAFLFSYSNRWVNRLTAPALARHLSAFPSVPAWAAQAASQWHAQNNRTVVRLAKRLRPDLSVVLRGEHLLAETLQAVRGATRGPLVSWWVDAPERYPVSAEWWRSCDHVFLFDRACVRRLTVEGVAKVHFLPCACDEEVFWPRALSERQRRRYQCEVALVGWYYPNRLDVVRALESFRLGVWGPGWTCQEARAALNGTSRRIVVRGRSFVADDEAALIYSAAAIGLNIHHPQTREAGLTSRTFELLATGTFPLVDAVPGMEELLTPGLEIETYRSPQEAREKAAYYLSDATARMRLVACGRRKTLEAHTYRHRMQTLLQQPLTMSVKC